jgi:pSer/pThr/pTyr-binding forkhead associated (FHA) protein
MTGDREGRLLPLDESEVVSIGRDDQCTFQILDAAISRQHLQIAYDANEKRHYAADYRSANGVFVNGNRIMRSTWLVDGDEIRIGSTTLAFLEADHADADVARTALEEAKKRDEWKRGTSVSSRDDV